MYDIPVFIISTDLGWHIRVCEDGKLAVGLGNDGCALNILIIAEPDIHRRVADSLEQPSTGMLVEHTLAEGAELLPLVTTILHYRTR